MKKKVGIPGKLLVFLTFLFLYAPIIFLIVFSFNDSKSRTVWAGFTLDWYVKLFSNQMVLNSLYVTLILSALAAVISTIAGTFAAIGFFGMNRKIRTPLLAINNIPVINADIITGVSMSLLFISAGGLLRWLGETLWSVAGIYLPSLIDAKIELGFGTLLIAHVSFNIPYVILSVMPKLYQLDKNLFEAAQDLGCTWMQAFYKVIIPEISPGIVNGMIIAFTMSIDDFVISYFTAGSKVQTLSMTIFAMTRRRVSPEINAISTLLFAAVFILLLFNNIREARQEKVWSGK